MATQVAQLMARLRDAEFRKKLLAVCENATIMAAGFCNDPPSSEYDDLKDDWQSSLGLAMSVQGWIPDILEERTKPLSNPRIIAPGELWDEFEVYLEDECCGITDERYDAYLDHIENRLLKPQRSESFTLCELTFPENTQRLDCTIRGMVHGVLLTRAEILGNVSEEDVKKSADALFTIPEDPAPQLLGHIGEFKILFGNIEFRAIEPGFRRPDPDKRTNGNCQVQLAGRSSVRSMRALVSELAPLAQSHFRSVKFLEAELNVDNFKKFLPFGIGGLEMASLNTSNKDTFQRRIANAVRLLAEADNQRSDPIGLSLCVAAIDALLGRDGPEMTKTLADFVAGLLEPKVDQRREAANFVEDLYKKRSRVLHGDRLEGNSTLRNDARKLAASVLFGVWSHLGFFERWYKENPEPRDPDMRKPENFFAKLREDFVKPGLPVGVLELPVRTLWQKNSPGNE